MEMYHPPNGDGPIWGFHPGQVIRLKANRNDHHINCIIRVTRISPEDDYCIRGVCLKHFRGYCGLTDKDGYSYNCFRPLNEKELKEIAYLLVME